ncbi:MAG: hypothetical protein F4246_03460 [Rhodothermaceae bacterium]|nr:hypothetical protein [Rhodothermaceae bacterium]MYD56055.1 hypothetical protein [Rhodothermaceae bacterium]MYJ57048.1 hypothetical protein [Rhodothermaceae bacterium]
MSNRLIRWAHELLQQRGKEFDIKDLAGFSEEDLFTLIHAMLADERWDVFRIWYKKRKWPYPVSVGVGAGRDAREGLIAYLVNNSKAEDGTYYVCKGPGDKPRVAHPLVGVRLEVKDEQITQIDCR